MLADKFNSDNGIDLRKDPMALQRLKEAAENAKKDLSSAQQAEINLPQSPSAASAQTSAALAPPPRRRV